MIAARSWSSHSSSSGTPCSRTNTCARMRRASRRTSSQLQRRMANDCAGMAGIIRASFESEACRALDDNEAAQCPDEIGLRVYSSRLLGRDKTLVLHGGGNTSSRRCKRTCSARMRTSCTSRQRLDLETIEEAGFAPVQMDYLLRLAQLDALSDTQMVNQLATHMLKSSAPAPSVETILHACLPHKFVDHTHADAILAITNAPEGNAASERSMAMPS